MKKKTKKTLKELAKEIAKCIILFAAGLLGMHLTSCGSTKVSVSKPAEGTSTTITVTTNNPISTSVNPNLELKTKEDLQ